jgi:hypothetical protein
MRGKVMRLSLFQLLFGFRVATDDVWSTSITLLNLRETGPGNPVSLK